MKKLNEILAFRDPFILADETNSTYYMWGTSGNEYDSKGQGLIYYKSKNLEEWEGPFDCLRNDAFEVDQQDFWAPEVHKIGNKYYMFATFGPMGEYRRTQILVSDHPEKTFVPLGLATPKGTGCLDATIHCQDGKYYSVYCREWITNIDDDQTGTMQYAEIKSDFTGIDEGTVCEIFKATDSPLWGGGDVVKVTDACFMHRSPSGQLFMLWSTFGVNKNYVWTYCYSDNGKIDGNWIQSNEALFADDGGHGMIFKDFEGNLRAVFHLPNSGLIERPQLFYLKDTEVNKLELTTTNPNN